MKLALRTLVLTAAALLPLAWAVSCEPASPDSFIGMRRVVEEEVKTQVALSLEPVTGTPGTKMNDAVTQVNANTDHTVFRGIDKVFIIPFKSSGAITASDTRHGQNLRLPQTGIPAQWNSAHQASAQYGLVTNNNSHLYENVYMKSGTTSVLVYGKAIDQSVSVSPDSVAFKRRNGVLRSHGLGGAETPVDMWFELEPIIGAAEETSMNTAIQGVLSYLNNIAGAQVSVTGYASNSWSGNPQTSWTYIWSTPAGYGNYGTLKTAFETLTGSNLPFSGSTDAIAGMLTSIYNGLYDLASSTNNSNSYIRTYYTRSGYTYTANQYYYVYELAREIRTRINSSTYVTLSGSGNNVTVSFKSNYAGVPASYGVPEGAVAIEWNGTQFVRVSADNSAIAPVSTYCYPPSLWYWTNSRLKTSDDESVSDKYISSNTTWADILANYTLGSTVLPGITSAAVQEPLQYGVAQLRLRFNYALSYGNTEILVDSHDQAISVSNDHFPLTGVLVSEQKHQAFNFTPKTGDNYCIYDSDVNDGSGPKAYIAGSSAGLSFKPIHTLVVQTENNQDVHYALEFQNNSGSPFYGDNGCIVSPGSKFYLVGTLELGSATNTTSETINCVFLQDHITEAVVTVKSLKDAYNTIPELRDPQLQIGVQTEMKWVGTTPAQIPMY